MILKFGISFNYRGKELLDVKKDNILSSDFRKYDGMLRMIISSTIESRKKLKKYLMDLFAAKKIFYGFHVSDSALLTCMLHYDSGNEVHFVDAADGGYALAAKEMKKQIHQMDWNKYAK